MELDKPKELTICYFGTYRAEYSRNKIMINGLLQNDVGVIECHEKLWTGIEDRIHAVQSGWFSPKFWLRVIKVYWKLIRKYIKIADYDVMVVGYPGQFDIFLARILTWIKRKPLVWDIFMSIYLVSIERNLDQQHSLSVRFLYFIENIALRLPNMLIIDTAEYAKWFEKNYKINRNRFHLVPTGADDRIFSILEPKKRNKHDEFIVLYYGTFIPNHGVPYIIEAAKLLNFDSSFKFRLIGSGPELYKCKELAEEYKLNNVEFISWVEQDSLKNFINASDIVLGAFGMTPQSLMTIQNKIYESMSMGKLVISGDSEAIRNSFQHNGHILLCNRENPQTLVNQLISIKTNPTKINEISKNALELFNQSFTIKKNGSKFKDFLIEANRNSNYVNL